MIEVDNVTKNFDDFVALDRLSFRVPPNHILALLGPNGAGKTTMARLIAALLVPSSGRILVDGYDTVTEANHVRERVGLLTESPGLYERMAAFDYILLFGELRSMSQALLLERTEFLMKTFDLWEQRRASLGTYSKGMRQKMALIRALLHDPPVLLMDEPTSALDPGSAKIVRDHILSLKSRGWSILICTHNLTEAEELADTIAIIHRGRLVAIGSPQELRAKLTGASQYRLTIYGDIASYLGCLDGLVKIDRVQGAALLFSTSHPQETNPIVIERLVEAGAKVVSLTESKSNLEAVYLQIVEEASHG